MPLDKGAAQQHMPAQAHTITAAETLAAGYTMNHIITTGTYTITLPTPPEGVGRGIYHFYVVCATGAFTIADTYGAATYSKALVNTKERVGVVSNGLCWNTVYVTTA